MEEIPDKFKRVSQVQLDIWLADPTTKAYLTCLKEKQRVIGERLEEGSMIDTTNNDRSMNLIHSALGTKDGLRQACEIEYMFKSCEMVEE